MAVPARWRKSCHAISHSSSVLPRRCFSRLPQPWQPNSALHITNVQWQALSSRYEWRAAGYAQTQRLRNLCLVGNRLSVSPSFVR